MALVTIQVLEGLERGRVYEDVPTPITIGREDDNHIRLNDERVSRFHAKIQEDGDRIILTDLDSTNGTRVNGHPMQMKVLHVGDQVSIGRCILVYGSSEEIAARLGELADSAASLSQLEDRTIAASPGAIGADDEDGSFAGVDADYRELFPAGPPELPMNMSPVQRAQFSDVLAYMHDRIRSVLEAAVQVEQDDNPAGPMNVPWADWQRLVQLEMELARYLRKAADPDTE